MALTKISTGGVKDDAASQAKIADEAIDEARLQVSNAGTNGQFLSKQSGNTGGLTWATAITTIADDSITQAKIADDAIGQDQLADNAVVLANLTNDCVTADKIADNAIAESRLEISNAGTNGQYLQKQSGNTGGLTWADVSAGSTVDLVADGALAIDDAVYVTSAGKAKKIAEESTENTPLVKPITFNNQRSEDTMDTNRTPGICYDPDTNRIHYLYSLMSNQFRIIGYALDSKQQQATTSSDSAYKEGTLGTSASDYHRLIYDTNTDRIVALYANSGELKGRVISVASDGTYTLGTEQTIMNASAAWIDACFDPTSNKILVVWSEEGNSHYGACKLLTVDISGSAPGTLTIGDLHRFEGSNSAKYCSCIKDPDANKFIIAFSKNSDNQLHLQTATISSGSNMTFGTQVGCTDNSSEHTYWPRMCYDTVNDLIVVLYTINPSGNASSASRRLIAASVSGTDITFKTPDNLGSSASSVTKLGNHDINWDPTINKAIAWHIDDGSTKRLFANKVYHSGNASDQYAYELKLKIQDAQFQQVSDVNLLCSTITDKGQHYSFAKNDDNDYGSLSYVAAATTALNSNGFDNIGFSKAAYSNGANATIKTVGNIVSNKSSLTIGANYYLQNDGTYGTTRQLGYGGFRAISATSGIITSGVNHNSNGSVIDEWYLFGNAAGGTKMSSSTYLNDNNWTTISGNNSSTAMKHVALHYGKKSIEWTGSDLSNIKFPETGKWKIEWMGFVWSCQSTVSFYIYRSTNGTSGTWEVQGKQFVADADSERYTPFNLTVYLDIDDVVKNVCSVKCQGVGNNETRISTAGNHREAGNKLVFTKIS